MKKLNKKGFTLVELIVVIAIIGVLAAILIPTMIGYSFDAKITSANSTAANVRKTINGYLTEVDGQGNGMRVTDGAVTDGKIEVVDGVWTLTLTDFSWFNEDSITWDGTGIFDGDIKISETDSAEDVLVKRIAASLPDVNNCFIKFNLKSGNCNALYMTTETSADITMPTFSDTGWPENAYEWDGENAGVSSEGYIVGTSPVLVIG